MQANNTRNALKSAANSLDKRTRAYRLAVTNKKRHDNIYAAVLADLGGEQNVGAVMQQLADKFATLAMKLEDLQDAAHAGIDIDLDLFGRNCGQFRRMGETLGLQRQARLTNDVTRARVEELWDQTP
jgi:hypothetical protein